MNGFSAIIVAAGRGKRIKDGDVPKQYRHIGEHCVLSHSMAVFLDHPKVHEVICVIHPDDRHYYDMAIAHLNTKKLHPPIYGGQTRGQSVRAGLKAAQQDYVLIHDGARPFLAQDALERLMDALRKVDAAFLAVPMVDSLWRINGDDLTPVARQQLWRAQTPQGFARQALCNAYEIAPDELGDDVAVAMHAGIHASPVLGNAQNDKITYAQDLERANERLGDRMAMMDIRVGSGFDVHGFCDGEYVILNGIKIAHDCALHGHSDADVAMHAISDAIYGALGAGDIGQHFPPSDAQWQDADSALFLRHACDLAANATYKINNIDCTIICERPKIAPHAAAMRKKLAAICAIAATRINIKATTSEGLGFIGRNEGIAAQASVTLVRR